MATVPTYRGLMETFMLLAQLAEALKALSRTEGATLYMTLLAAFKAMLFRYTGQEDILLGGVKILRGRPELQPLIGCFLDTIALRTRPSADLAFRDIRAQVRDSVLGALDASRGAVRSRRGELFVGREPGTHPLFQVMYPMQPLVDAFPDGWD